MEKRYGPWVVRSAKRLRLTNTMRALDREEAPMYLDTAIQTEDFIEAHYEPGMYEPLPTLEVLRRLRYDIMKDFWPVREIEVHLHLPAHVDGMEIYAW